MFTVLSCRFARPFHPHQLPRVRRLVLSPSPSWISDPTPVQSLSVYQTQCSVTDGERSSCEREKHFNETPGDHVQTSAEGCGDPSTIFAGGLPGQPGWPDLPYPPDRSRVCRIFTQRAISCAWRVQCHFIAYLPGKVRRADMPASGIRISAGLPSSSGMRRDTFAWIVR